MPTKNPKRQPVPPIYSITYWRKFASHKLPFLFIAGIFTVSIIAYFGTGQGQGMRGGSNAAESTAQAASIIVNGEIITHREFDNQWSQYKRFVGGDPTQALSFQGMALTNLINQAVSRSVAKKRGIVITDDDIEKAIAQAKLPDDPKNGKPATDEEFEKRLESQGVTLAEVKDQMHTSLLPKKLMDSFSDLQKVTENDLLKTFDKIKGRRILISVLSGKRSLPKALSDATAKRRAEEILVKLKAGDDFAKLADEFTTDPSNDKEEPDKVTKKMVKSKQGGLLPADEKDGGWYGYEGFLGKQFSEAAFALKKGQISEVVKTEDGYQIIKVDDTKRDLPKDYAKTKTELIRNLQQKLAQKPFQELMEKEQKSAKIEWKDTSLQWRYDYSKVNPGMGMMQQPQMPDPGAQDTLLAELRKYVTDHKDDGEAYLVIGQLIEKTLMLSALPGQKVIPETDKPKLQMEVMDSYEQALKHIEDKNVRTKLADLYIQQKKPEKALEQYDRISRMHSYEPNSADRFVFQELERSYKRIGRDDLAVKSKDRYNILNALYLKEDAEKKAKAVADKVKADADKAKAGAAISTKLPGGALNVKPGTSAASLGSDLTKKDATNPATDSGAKTDKK